MKEFKDFQEFYNYGYSLTNNHSEYAKREAKHMAKKAGNVALIIITSPIWLPVAIVLSPLIIWFFHDINKHGWH